MGKLFVHIGQPKTATTTIQNFLEGHRLHLASRGYLYPGSGAIWHGHHNLVYSLVGDPKYRADKGNWQDLDREIRSSGCDHVLLSAENFSSCGIRHDLAGYIQRFADALGLEVVIIAYIRPQYRYLDAIYAHSARSGYTSLTCDAYIRRYLGNRQYDFESLFARWLRQFPGRVIIRPFEPQYLSTSIVDDFLDCVGLAGCQKQDQEIVSKNERVGAKTVAYIRRVTGLLENLGVSSPQKIDMATILARACQSRGLNQTRFCGLDQERAVAIERLFEKSNQRFARQHLGQSRLFQETSDEFNFVRHVYDLSRATPADLAELTAICTESLSHLGRIWRNHTALLDRIQSQLLTRVGMPPPREEGDGWDYRLGWWRMVLMGRRWWR